MACGTPVIAWNCGSVPEIIDEGITGCVVDNIDAAVAAIDDVSAFDRAVVRRRFEERFSAERMVEGYLATYQRAIDIAAASMSSAA
jgi:glycosyltransferase involved in cell wall biosynthesis